MDAVRFRLAVESDVDAIVALVNSAYRGDSSRAGWTTEADFLDGQRTDAREVSELVGDDGSAILLMLQGEDIIGTAEIKRHGDAAYTGMIVVKPVLQGHGLGKTLLHQVEQVVAEWGLTRIRMLVITLRTELIDFYLRRGYRCTGEYRPFPKGEQFGIPKRDDLKLEYLEKSVDSREPD